jgi:hypothetical protein
MSFRILFILWDKYDFVLSCLCDLYRVRECNSTYETSEIQALKEVKNAISKEATRFSGNQQHVSKFYSKKTIFKSLVKKKYNTNAIQSTE